MPYTLPTTKTDLTLQGGGDHASNHNNANDAINNMLRSGTNAARLAASHIPDGLWRETDTGYIYRDTGSSWELWRGSEVGLVSTLAGVLDDSSNAIKGVVITPGSDAENGIIFRRPGSTYGSPFVYGDGQAFMAIKEGTGSVHTSLILARIDGRSGAAGFAGGLHSAGGLHKDAGDATPNLNLWVQNNLDMVGVVVQAYGTSPAYAYQIWEDGSANIKASVTKDGVLAAYAADTSYGSVYVSSSVSTTPATITLGTGGAAVDATIGVAGAANDYLTGSAAKDLVIRGINGGVIIGDAGVINMTFGGAAGIYAGTGIAMVGNKVSGLGAPTAATDAATKGYADKLLGYLEVTNNATSTSTTTGNDTWTTNSLTITIVADGSRSVQLEAFCSVASNNTAGDGCQMSIYEGATQIATAVMTSGTASKGSPLRPGRIITPSAGSHTYVVKLNAIAGGTATFTAAAGPGTATPAWLMAKYV